MYSCEKCGNLLNNVVCEFDFIQIKDIEIVLYTHNKTCKKENCEHKGDFINQAYYNKYSIKVLILENNLKFKLESDILYLNKNLNLGFVLNTKGKTGANFKLYKKHDKFLDLFIFKTNLFIKMKDSD
jgi:hypothetical protein